MRRSWLCWPRRRRFLPRPKGSGLSASSMGRGKTCRGVLLSLNRSPQWRKLRKRLLDTDLLKKRVEGGEAMAEVWRALCIGDVLDIPREAVGVARGID